MRLANKTAKSKTMDPLSAQVITVGGRRYRVQAPLGTALAQQEHQDDEVYDEEEAGQEVGVRMQEDELLDDTMIKQVGF